MVGMSSRYSRLAVRAPGSARAYRERMARLFVTTGNDQFTQALVTSLSECDVELVDEAGAATHVLLGARPVPGWRRR